jgi:predicted DNA binding CopG/RHH family protein
MNGVDMKMSERIKKRLRKDRAMTTISMRLPEDVIDDLKEVAPARGFSGYQPLIRAYIGQGLRKDLARMENSQVQILTESLRRHGVKDEVISEAIAEARLRSA